MLDEIIAIPICFTSAVALAISHHTGALRIPRISFRRRMGWKRPRFSDYFVCSTSSAFPPVGRSQELPGGWGVTVDDVLAAVYVNLVVLVLAMLFPGFS